ncbi:conserved hypothetical protein [Candidatus Zixiibacteriota bacterium]|nr:conserved hypothetical protein [candidate division Zixibacteria bacterium]
MITADDYIEDLLKKYDGINKFLMERGIICVVCGEPVWGTLGELVKQKGLDLGNILSELNDRFRSE